MKGLRFILVDDEKACNMIGRLVLSRAIAGVRIDDFTDPEQGLDFIKDTILNTIDDTTTVLFLDINMPLMTGWEFLERLEGYEEAIEDKIKIYILSSSIDRRDKELAENSYLVSGFLSKPLRVEKVLEVLDL